MKLILMLLLRRNPQPFLSNAIDHEAGGAEGIRTPDPHNAIVVLYQLSYDPSLN
jgi:hypothetical protein